MTAEVVHLQAYRDARAVSELSPALLAEKRPVERGEGMGAMIRCEEQRWVEHRDEERHRVEGKCLPFVAVNGVATRLQNVSRGGLQVRSDVDAAPGSRVLLTIAGCSSLSARVIWERDGFMGLEAPLASMSLAAL
jgi:hypothetical protein